MVCDGVLPIDQMREYTGPITLVIKRIMKEVLEATYGLDIQVKSVEDGSDGVLRAEDLLTTYAGTRSRQIDMSCCSLGGCSCQRVLPSGARHTRRSPRGALHP